MFSLPDIHNSIATVFMPLNHKKFRIMYEPPSGAYARYLVNSGQFPKPGEEMPEQVNKRAQCRIRAQHKTKKRAVRQ
jgi:hypothetical protein